MPAGSSTRGLLRKLSSRSLRSIGDFDSSKEEDLLDYSHRRPKVQLESLISSSLNTSHTYSLTKQTSIHTLKTVTTLSDDDISSSPSTPPDEDSLISKPKSIITIEEPGEAAEAGLPILTAAHVEEEHAAAAALDQLNTSTVRFSRVQIREYPISIGDNPSVLKGVPITLGWDVVEESTCTLEKFESRPNKRSLGQLKMSSLDRCRMAKSAGYSGQEITEAIKNVDGDRQRRQQTVAKLGRSEFHFKIESMRRAILNATIRKAAKKREREYLKPFKTNNVTTADGHIPRDSTILSHPSSIKKEEQDTRQPGCTKFCKQPKDSINLGVLSNSNHSINFSSHSIGLNLSQDELEVESQGVYKKRKSLDHSKIFLPGKDSLSDSTDSKISIERLKLKKRTLELTLQNSTDFGSTQN